MTKKLLLICASLLCAFSLMAQSSDFGGVKATVVNRAGRVPIPQAQVELYQNNELLLSIKSDAEGRFLIEDIQNGAYKLLVKGKSITFIFFKKFRTYYCSIII